MLPLSVSATPEQALSGQAVPAEVCTGNPVSLDAGAHRLQLAGDRTTAPLSLTAVSPGFAGPAPTGTTPAAAGTPSLARDRAAAGRATVLGWGRTDRRVAVAAGPESLLVVHENANAGWQATLGGRRLAATTVDGWEQGFVLPAHAAGTVHLRFAPQRDFLLGLSWAHSVCCC